MNIDIKYRRLLIALLVGGTVATAIGLMAKLLSYDGWSVSDSVMVLLFAMTTPWVALGFWNSLIGLILVHSDKNWLATVAPFTRSTATDSEQISSRTAVVMPVYNEDTERVFNRLRVVLQSLDATDHGDRFELFLLSDSTEDDIVREEQRRFAELKTRNPHPQRIHYRRRTSNSAGKAGNVWDFCQHQGDNFDYMVVLDADSVMSGQAVARLVRNMQANPQIGILQTLAVGLPSDSPFGRIMQFGMRQGMRPYTVGSAWWQGPAGPYWGHNAIIRLEAFRAHCRLPRLPGGPPLGGHILSHDQVEAVLMHRAGYEVWVLPVEDGSFEESPPTLTDFLGRDLRWCQGNMQYLRLLNMRGLRPLSRVQLGLAILMYLAAPAWLGFLLLGFGQVIAAGNDGLLRDPASVALGFGIFTGMMGLTLAPKIMGFLDLTLRSEGRRAYGGRIRIGFNALIELVASILVGPIVAVTQTLFLAGLPFGKRIAWNAQARDAYTLNGKQALRALWPQLLLGIVGTLLLANAAPASLPWATPILLGLLLAVPFALLTSSPSFGNLMSRFKVCATPEELRPPPEVAALGLGQERPHTTVQITHVAEYPAKP